MGQLLGIAKRERSGAPMETIERVDLSEDMGVAGDYRGKLRKRQVSVLAREDWERACESAGAELPWTTRRANLLVEGLTLKETEGGRLKIGDAVLEIMMETDPCAQMDKAFQGLRKALEPDWRGGVCCRVIRGGAIAVGDEVELEAP